MNRFTTRSRVIRLMIATVALGMLFLPGTALAQESTTTTSTSIATTTTIASTSTTDATTSTSEPGGELPDLPAITELPLLGSNITIELGTDENGVLASVTVDGELADFELEMEDGEIKIEFVFSNDNGTFEVEVKFEDDDFEVEVEGFVAAGDYTYTGEACEGGALSVSYTVTEDGGLLFGSATGDVVDIEADGDEIEVRYADGSRVELEMDDGELSIEFSCHDADDDDFDDESDESDDDSDDDDDDDDESDDDDDDDSDDDDDDDDSDDDE